jgi:hypothetical protein
VRRQAAGEVRQLGYATTGGLRDGAMMYPVDLGDRAQRTDYLSTVPAAEYESMFVSGARAEDGTLDIDSIQYEDARPYTKGQSLTQMWNAAVFGPAFSHDPIEPGGWRSGDNLSMTVAMHNDAYHTGAFDMLNAPGSTTVSVNGKIVRTEPTSGFTGFEMVELPSRKSTIRIATVADRAPAWASLSRHVAAEWTFTSQTTPEEVPTMLPLQVVRFTPGLYTDNTAAAGPFTMPLQVQGVDPTLATTVKAIVVNVSYDGGKTWAAAGITGTGTKRTVSVNNPAGGTVSLQAIVTDAAGNTSKLTTIGAYTVR